MLILETLMWVLSLIARQPCDTSEQCEAQIRPLVEHVFTHHHELNNGQPITTPDHAGNIIQCESTWKPTARNPTSTAGGLFQFLAGTWHAEAHRSGWPHPAADPANRFDPVLSVKLAADVVARDGGWRQWQCRP